MDGRGVTAGAPAPDGAFDPLALSVWAHAVAMVAEEMGAVLVRAAVSPNIRERRDASAAVFDATGRMVAQAAHIPVHLGAMPEAVAAVRARGVRAGDVFLLNDPAHGGSHLPDLTLVEAVTDPDEPGATIGYVAVRAHHADVGGMSPGSMPQGATELVQEGLVLPPVRLARVRPDGTADVVDDVLAIVLANVRTPGERLGDLRAQLAACAAGRAAWQALWRREGGARVGVACDALLDYAERRTRARLAAFEGAAGAAEDALEGDGVSDAPVRVRAAVRVADGRLRVDLAGTAPRVAGNVNCPRAVARAAAVFALRTLLDDDVPTNDGVARALDLVVPDGCAADARDGAAVAAGNVEMSQRLADVMLAALAAAGIDVPAQGQGTMNNVTFGAPAAPGGAAGWTFYETLGGGQGASSRGAGPSGVHVGMSNTRVTPVEALELAYPLRVERYALRDGSGGAGAHGGGDGVVRDYRALADCTVTLLTERRRLAPRGAAGGGDGAPGRNLLDGAELPAKTRVALAAGQMLSIETPGGGGWGAPTRAGPPPGPTADA
jgi:N-methylhydantoinase B